MAEVRKETKKRMDALNANDVFAVRVRRIATHRNMTIPEVLDKYAGASIAREYQKIADEMNRDIGGES